MYCIVYNDNNIIYCYFPIHIKHYKIGRRCIKYSFSPHRTLSAVVYPIINPLQAGARGWFGNNWSGGWSGWKKKS